MQETSQQLVTRVQSGDAAAIDVLLERHLPDLRAYIRVRCSPLIRARESTSDILQSTCREVLEHIERFEYQDEAHFRHWLFETAMRKLIDRKRYYRAAKRDVIRERAAPPQETSEAPGLEAEGAEQQVTPSQDAMAREQLERLEHALGQLDEEEREFYAMFQIIGMTSAQIARDTGRSEAAVRKQKSRLLTKISALMVRGKGEGERGDLE